MLNVFKQRTYSKSNHMQIYQSQLEYCHELGYNPSPQLLTNNKFLKLFTLIKCEN